MPNTLNFALKGFNAVFNVNVALSAQENKS